MSQARIIMKMKTMTQTHSNNLPKVYIEPKAYQRMKAFVQLCEDEIAGLGEIVYEEVEGKKALVVKSIDIFEQEVGPGHADLDSEAVAKFMHDKFQEGFTEFSRYRFWWHSHAKMDVFFSGRDVATIDSSTEFPWLVSLVTNHEGDLKARFDLYEPVRCHINLEVVILEEYDEDLYDECAVEIANKVTQEKSYGFQGRYLRDDEDDLPPPKGKIVEVDLDDEDFEEADPTYEDEEDEEDEWVTDPVTGITRKRSLTRGK